jgi:hypothetical protein
MDWTNPRSVEAKIARLTREIAEVDKFFYKTNENDDRALYAGMLERNAMTVYGLPFCNFTRQ